MIDPLGLVLGALAGTGLKVAYDAIAHSAKRRREVEGAKEHFAARQAQNDGPLARLQVGPVELEVAPWISIKDKGEAGWRVADLRVEWQEEPRSLPPDLNRYIDTVWTKATAGPTQAELRDESRCGLVGLAVGGGFPLQLRLRFCRTSYRRFWATNRWLDDYRRAGFPFNDDLRGASGYLRLSSSLLSNDLGTGTTVVTRDRRVILALRSRKTAVLPSLHHTSIAQGMVPEKDMLDGAPNPILTVVRGAQEELNLRITPADVRILAFGSYKPYAQPYMVARVNSDRTASDIISTARARQPDRKWEGEVLSVEFTTKGLARYLLDPGRDMSADSAKACLLLALIDEYGRQKVEDQLYDQFLSSRTWR